MSKGKFITGFGLGIAAGLAAKYLLENKDEVILVAKEKASAARNEFGNFLDYASDKVNDIGDEVSKKAGEYADYAKEQFQGIKESLAKEEDSEQSDSDIF